MELLEKAKSSNDFGLRSRFPWSDSEKSSPWTKIVTNSTEKLFVLSKVGHRIDPRIKRIENPYLWARYVLRHEELNAYYKELDITVNEFIVIHATTSSNALSIADINFDWRRVHRGRFGQGVSFSGNASYAHKYASNKGTYIVAGILIGKMHEGSYSTIIPNHINYDTTNDARGYVFVKYYDDDFYPYYIVE